MFVKFRAPLDAARKVSPALRFLLGDALDTARPLSRRPLSGPLPAGLERLYVLELPEDADIPLFAAKLSGLAEVEYAEPVLEATLVGEPAVAVPAAVPNDPQYVTQQAYLPVMQVESAWNVVKGQDSSPVVCVIDGGTNWQHEDLQANMWVNPAEIPGNAIDDDNNGYVDDVHGWDFRANDGNVRGDWGATQGNANHGTHTAGLLAAVTNNGVGIACASWNPRLMAVNASGTQDGRIDHGYEGIVYAADNGARIVSLSWGGPDASQANQDIIDYAVAQGVLVIAAAGNDNASRPFYPAAYRDVVAVANVWGHDPNGVGVVPEVDTRYSTGSASNYGGWLDVAAAGTAVYSTFDFNLTNQYGTSTGTSMSAPVAAAVAALIQSLHPTWGPLQVGEQLRMTCDNVNGVLGNGSVQDLMGRGRVNALRAVTESHSAVRVTEWSFADADGNGELNQGETVTVSIDVHNYLEPVAGLGLALSSSSPYVLVTEPSENVGSLATGGTASLPAAFTFTVAAGAPLGTQLDLRVDMSGTGYSDFQWLPVLLEPIVETHDVNELTLSLTSTGNLGWLGFAGGWGEKGEGFRFHGGPNLLFEGALMLGRSASALSDAARTNTEHTDFAPADNLPPVKTTPGPRADQEILGPFADTANTTTPLGVRVQMHSLAYGVAPYEDFVYVGYEIFNTSVSAFADFWVGLFLDWDIDANGFDQNRAGWDATRLLGYAWNATNPSLPHVGVMALSGPQAAYSAIRNDGVGQPVNIYYNGFSKSEKWTLLHGGTGIQSVGPTDLSNALSVGPFVLERGESLQVWFALLAGENLADLQGNADWARSLFGDSIQTAIGEPAPEIVQLPQHRLELDAAVPNPFNPGTRLALHLDRRRSLHVAVFDVRGRLVRTLVDGVRPAGDSHVSWDGRDGSGRLVPSGVYYVGLSSELERRTRRLVLTR